MTPTAQTAEVARIRAVAGELGSLELQASRVRADLYQAVRNAARRGVAHVLLADAAGVSRQRVGQIVAEGNGR